VLLLYTLAGALPMASVLFFYSTIPGGLQAFYLATIRFNLDVYTSFHGPFHPSDFVFWGGYLLPFAILGFMASRKQNLRSKLIQRPVTRNEQLLYGSLLFSFLAIGLVQRKFPLYHFAPFYLLLCPM